MNDQEERLRIPCFSHTLQLTVGDGLKECENAKPALAKVAAIAKLRSKHVHLSLSILANHFDLDHESQHDQ
ncbi:unnamed protein product [Rotaria sp. Silwood1]|nr:unnamed protein product [Rotaria sp. Silwood1]CAF0740677.1 unnamed protein product [Rotaria sp. Silwood1]CAF3345788.1 unnamed protein product [Rotaria sp. Silwood1]CAF3349749.1 unnamed protein product [Rotaria sp. Silwood1]CAF4573536.1 unnamed protein product [Rotaria sp. Silwood1]